ncbi:MAG: GNAT family N-acetyltransferase [Acidimicrobiia bacterium]|nr:GNAT family N-acetyltransferase [Acidimicrobiia bacterium]MDH5421135.1 GNAT family N-acetyltransferase [Acidimicrobiia bacterium]MDH5503513.1 GNAT family N-acetyltransferase [Acidimicrobiia bacterium]
MQTQLPDGETITIRPIEAADRAQLVAGFDATSEQSRFFRFMRGVDHLTETELDYLVNVDGRDHVALVAVLATGQGIGVARYVRDPDDATVAEAALIVVDAHQGRGIGTNLLQALADTALENGISAFTAYVLPENRAVVEAMTRAGADTESEDSLLRMTIRLPIDASLFADSALRAALRRAAAGELSLNDQF